MASSSISTGSVGKKEAPSAPATGREVALVSSDGQKFFVPPSVVRTSRVLGKKLKDIAKTGKGGKGNNGSCGDGSLKSWDKSFTLDQITGDTLSQVIRWARHHKGGCVYKVSGERVAHTTPWDDQFVAELQRDDLFKLSLAAKDLEIEGLLQLTCKEIAKMISGKTPEQVRSEFGVVCDFTPEEEEEIRRENELLFGELCEGQLSAGEEVTRGIEGLKVQDKEQSVPMQPAIANGTASPTTTTEKKEPENRLKPVYTWYEPIPSCRCRYCHYYYTRRRANRTAWTKV